MSNEFNDRLVDDLLDWLAVRGRSMASLIEDEHGRYYVEYLDEELLNKEYLPDNLQGIIEILNEKA